MVPLALSACGTAASPAPTVTAKSVAEIQAGDKFNDTDVMFLQMMVYHQKQGLEMTTTATSRAANPQLKTLAAAVQATEKDELSMMKAWLTQWAKPTDVDTSVSLHADHGGLPATGPAEIKALKTVSAASFDTAFLNLFLAHQHNAIEMAHLETTNGANAEAKAFASRVRESRQAEVQQMLTLMNS
ncbi:DUF305 domain-containing protein [Paractinoplanes durhamensis]|uniref:DUF305 domain-containing protein n=1 Tax=Paractinoplanes durhamensis TaxID=113563 RepID=A0ABQ3Z800_9ACTN|nr:DUF305 domain-containing protein [Actinoplanes durhamensis]GIE05964.1 DUF305 domain-containing protein [Actinoplanes durhamensis]